MTTPKLCSLQMATSKVGNSAQFLSMHSSINSMKLNETYYRDTKNVFYFDSILWHSVHNLDVPFKPILSHLILNNFTNHAKFFIYNPLLFYMLMNLDSVINICF
jgi:hypothetical protein